MSTTNCAPPPVARRGRVCVRAVAVVCVAALLGAPPAGADDQDLDLQPLVRPTIFHNAEEFEPETVEEISEEIAGSFADLNKVALARERLVHRFGVVSVRILERALRGNSQPHAWNAALTLAGLRDTLGPDPVIQGALPAIQRLMTAGGEEYGRAFAALALGCFPWTEGQETDPVPTLPAMPGPPALRKNTRRILSEAVSVLHTNASSPSNSGVLARASLLAMAKMGGPDASKRLCSIGIGVSKSVQYRQALLLARAFAHTDDPQPCFDAMRVKETQKDEVAAAALAVAVSVLSQDRHPWTKQRAKLKGALDVVFLRSSQEMERAAVLFALGVNALVNDAADKEWQRLWERTTVPSVEDGVAVAGAQVMLFCQRRWFHRQVEVWAHAPPTQPKDPVRAMLLLRAGELGTPDAVKACLEWIRSPSRRPAPTKAWDPRWYAIVGLLRALHHERLTDNALRAQVVAGLVRARKSVLRAGPFKDALTRLLDQHRAVLEGASRLDREALQAMERTLRRLDPWGLLGADARDVCAHRVNKMVENIFEFSSIVPSSVGEPQKTKQGERHLREYLDHYPYFSRLQFLTRRGTREPVRIDDAREMGLNR